MKSLLKPIVLSACRIVNYIYRNNNSAIEHIKAISLLGIMAIISVTLLLVSVIDFEKIYQLQHYKPPQPSKLLDRKGRLISTYFGKQHRIIITEKQIPQVLINSFVATEDNHFFSHWGIDLQAILRAFLTNLQFGGVKQGGSTITQQLAKVLLTTRERSYIRKAKEAIMSFYIESHFSKKQILTMYFNEIYFGHGNYGVEAASKFYFNKSIKDLEIGEAALLATLPSRPSGNSPAKYPRNSKSKLKHVLLRMIDMGFISRKQASDSWQKMKIYYDQLDIASSDTAFGLRINKAPYFTETIRRKLIKQVGSEILYKGGLRIHTSLDLDHQKVAQETLWKALDKQNKISKKFVFTKYEELAEKYTDILGLVRFSFNLNDFEVQRSFDQYKLQLHFYKELASKIELLNLTLEDNDQLDKFLNSIRTKSPYFNRYNVVQGALVEIDHKTGEITAMVGGSPFNSQNQINRVLQMQRQPGSAFKPLVYAAAMENNKITAATIFSDSPLTFLEKDGDTWMPENYSGGYRGFISVRKALAYSTNLVSVAIARQAGLSNIIPVLAKQLQLPEAAIPHNLSISLGSFEVSPLRLATAYSAFPNGGMSIKPFMVHKIYDMDNNLQTDYDASRQIQGERAMSQGTATVMTSLLKGVISSGTGGAARRYGYRGFAAGKTGTTQNWRDAWFAGFNDRYTTVVWLGYDHATLSLGRHQGGGSIAAPVWGEFQAKVAKFRTGEASNLHLGGVTNIAICEISGLLPTGKCSKVHKEIFSVGNAPTKYCEEDHGLNNNDNFDLNNESSSTTNSTEPKLKNKETLINEEDI